LSWAYLVGYALLGLIIKPILIIKIADYKWGEILNVFWECLKVTLVAVPIPLFLYFILDVKSILNSAIVLIASILFVAIAVWTLGLTKNMRERLVKTIKDRIPFLKNKS
jgi:hypothetical protein